MPRIPMYEVQTGLAAGQTAARVDPSLFGAPGAQMAQVAEFATDWAERRINARNEADLIRAKAQASRELLNLQLEFEQDTDWRTMEDRFQQRAKDIHDRLGEAIADPNTRASFTSSYSELFDAKRVNVHRRSWDLESNQSRADLDQVLTDNARNAANSNSGAEAARHLKDGLDAITRMQAAGYLSPEDAGKRQRRFLGDHDEAKVLGLINTAPAEAEKRLADPAQYQHLDPERRQRLYSQAATRADALESRRLREQERAERLAERSLKQRGEALAKEGWDMALGGKLSEEWLASNKKELDASDYRALRKVLADPDERPNNATAYGGLLRDLYVDGRDIRSDAMAAYERGDITARTLKTVLDENQSVQEKRGELTPGQRALSFVSQAMKHSDINPLPGQPQALANAMDDVRQWLGKNPAATADEAMTYARDTVRSYSVVNWEMLTNSMRTPLHFKGNRSLPDLDGTEASLRSAFDRGEIDENRLMDELELVQQWREAMKLRQPAQADTGKGKPK